MAEKRLKLTPAVHDAEDERVFVFDAVHNYVFAYPKPAVAGAEVFLARTPDVGKAGKHEETICDGMG